MQNFSRAVVACFLTTTLLSCGGGGDTTAPPVLTTLGVSFPSGTIQVGGSATATATGLDQHGAPIATGTISWSTGNTATATVNGTGVVTGVAAGQTQVIGSAGGKQAQALVTVIPAPVAAVTVSPPLATLVVGETQQLTATTRDITGNTLTGRVVTWASSDQNKATVSSNGVVTAVAAGNATITATSEGRSGSGGVTINSPPTSCNSGNSLQLAVGGVQALTAAEKASLCLGAGGSASEYVLIPFNSTSVAASAIQLEITATNTSAIQPGSLASLQPAANRSGLGRASPEKSFEWEFRERERRDVGAAFTSSRLPRRVTSMSPTARYLTGIPANPTVGSIVQINANISGNTCSDPKQLHDAEVVAVLAHTIVLSDTQSPAGGYTNAEMDAFGQAFETDGYPLDVSNFGAETDIDGNGRLAILFTPGVNVIPGPPGGRVGGLFASRDLFPVANCVASNEGEMFYMPVPDPNNTFNNRYSVKADIARGVLGTLAHEFQHLINAGRRIYVNNAPGPEEVWLNEGLSHIAEELLYYRMSGNSARSNVALSLVQSSQAQVDAFNTYQLNNFGRLSSYISSPETNSPFSQTDGLAMRGAIWQLLRYSADRRGGNEQTAWSALVNSTVSGQANFNAVFGDIVAMSRDWAVAQFADDAGLTAAPNYAYPSWHFRSIFPALTGGSFPLFTRPLLSAPVTITLNGGGAAYVRFRVAANVPATIAATSSGQAVPPAVDFTLMRTQ